MTAATRRRGRRRPQRRASRAAAALPQIRTSRNASARRDAAKAATAVPPARVAAQTRRRQTAVRGSDAEAAAARCGRFRSPQRAASTASTPSTLGERFARQQCITQCERDEGECRSINRRSKQDCMRAVAFNGTGRLTATSRPRRTARSMARRVAIDASAVTSAWRASPPLPRLRGTCSATDCVASAGLRRPRPRRRPDCAWTSCATVGRTASEAVAQASV